MSKRGAQNQITKDFPEEDGMDDRGQEDPVRQASSEIMSQRKIAVPRSRRRLDLSNNENSNTRSVNPFGFGPTNQSMAKPAQASPSQPEPVSAQQPTNGRDSEYDISLKRRGLNYSFLRCVQDSYSNDPFGDLSPLFKQYDDHRKAIPTSSESNRKESNSAHSASPKSHAATQPPVSSFNLPKTELARSNGNDVGSQDHPAALSGSAATSTTEKAPSFFGFQAGLDVDSSSKTNDAGPPEVNSGFTFGRTPSAASDQPTSFSFAPRQSPSDQPEKHKSPESKATTTANAFSFKAPDVEQGPKLNDDTKNEADTPVFTFGGSTPSRSNQGGKSFSWTPDQPIKFGSDKNSDDKDSNKTPPSFSFNNPLGSNKGSDSAFNANKSAFSFGSTASTGAKPNFGGFGSFGAATGQSSPSSAGNTGFSFGMNAQGKGPGDGTPAKQDEIKEADESFPVEARTNDELVAGKGQGEEDEDSVCLEKSKVFLFESEEKRFKDVGSGMLKINIHKTSKKARILARLEGSGRVICNVHIRADMKYTREGKKRIKFPSPKPDGTGIDIFLFQFGNENATKEIYEKISELQQA